MIILKYRDECDKHCIILLLIACVNFFSMFEHGSDKHFAILIWVLQHIQEMKKGWAHTHEKVS